MINTDLPSTHNGWSKVFQAIHTGSKIPNVTITTACMLKKNTQQGCTIIIM